MFEGLLFVDPKYKSNADSKNFSSLEEDKEELKRLKDDFDQYNCLHSHKYMKILT
jgi:tRNA(Phe) wybutosine-synthesizing methylase Tyw3